MDNENKKETDSGKFTGLQQEIAKMRATLRQQSSLLEESISHKNRLEKQYREAAGLATDKAKTSTITAGLKEAGSGIDSAKNNIAESQRLLGDLVGRLVADTDPRQQVSMLDDQYPVIMFPVRVETRFMTVKHIARVDKTKLPKTTPVFTVEKGKSVEKPISYAVKEVFPAYTKIPVVEDINELWIRVFPDDIAIHTHEQALSAIETDAGKSFWLQMWYAGKDASLELSAWRGLVNGRTPERAAWIMKQMSPVNQASAPATPVDTATALPVQPVFPTPPEKTSSWSKMPHSRVMPDRFVVRLYTGTTFREVSGKQIPDELPVSLDPQDNGAGLDNTEGKLVLPQNLWWIQDFDEAEKIGMAIRVPLSQIEKTRGFTKLLVLGLKLSADKDEGQKLVEDLIDNHHYKPGGFSIIPQGTPTNNSEDSLSGYTSDNSNDEALFKIELGAPQFVPVTVEEEKKDGQRVAEALGINYEKLQHINYAGINDIGEAIFMNKALWPTTFGYYLSQMMQPLFSYQDIANTKKHFQKFVLGRGRLPAIRVDNQPYGILPVTAFSKLTYPATPANSNNTFLRRLLDNVLKKLDLTWNSLAAEVKHADQTFSATSKDKAFLEILGLHPASVEYYQRYTTGPFFLWNLYAYSLTIQKTTSIPSKVSYANVLDFVPMFQSLSFILSSPPRVFDFIYAAKEKYLDGPVIDPFPFSEKRMLNAIGSGGENYIEWLYKSNYDTIAKEDFANIGAAAQVPPNSLLYLMLRHSCLLEYVRSGVNILVNKKVLSPEALLDIELNNVNTKTISPEIAKLVRTKIEFKEGSELDKKLNTDVEAEFTKRADSGDLAGMNFKEVQTARAGYYEELKSVASSDYNARVDALVERDISTLQFTTSKTGALAAAYDFTGTINLAQYIDLGIRKPSVETDLQEMAELRDALNNLSKLTTASLERLFSEHVDLASYRLDAWFQSLAAQRLDLLRNGGKDRQMGIYVASYSWLENLRPGLFPGIAYREVEIKTDSFTIPGIQEVALSNIEINVKVSPGAIKPFFTYKDAQLNKFAAAGREPVAAIKAAAFQRGELLGDASMIESGGVKIILDSTKDSVLVNSPDLLNIATSANAGPGYIYLGTSDPGSTMYDAVMDKFISSPRTDPGNQGFIHAPSVNQAATAALLRSGYESHKINPGSNPDAFAVNLSSNRIRRAMGFMEGIRNGQELAALLGYQFERGMHDLNANLDQYIRDIRLKYPFVAARVTSSTGAQDIHEAESYNVVDGLKLMEAFRDNPVHWADGIVFSPATDKLPVEQEILRLMDSMDAIHDLLLSESIHQAVQGNTARSNAAFNAISGTAVPPEPQIIETPRAFHALTHRVGVIFDPSAGGTQSWTTTGTPRSLAEPKLNKWLAGELPAKDKIIINCSFTDSSGVVTDFSITVTSLKIEPIDLLFLMDISLAEDVESELYQLISYYIKTDIAQSDNITIKIKNADRNGLDIDEITLAELSPLANSLLRLIQNGKSMEAKAFIPETETALATAANPAAGLKTAGLLSRLQDVTGVSMSNGHKGLSGLVVELTDAINTLAPNVPAFADIFDENQYKRLRAAMLNSSYFAVVNSVPSVALSFAFEDANELLINASRVLQELTRKNQQVIQLLATVAAQPFEDTKLKVLIQVGEVLFGRGFRLYPDFNLYTPASVSAARSYNGYLQTAGPHAVAEWLQGLAPVRKRIGYLQQWQLLSEALTGRVKNDVFKVIQLPLAPVDANGNLTAEWVGMKVSDGYVIPDNNLSLVISYPAGFDVNALHSGMIMDEWVEEIPIARANTGVAVHYNRPNSETPNVCLLAVSPDLNGSWSWDDLMATLDETLQWAKKRAVDPDLLNNTVFAQVLPAMMAALSGSDDTPTLDLGRNVVTKPKPGRLDLIKLDDYVLHSTNILRSRSDG